MSRLHPGISSGLRPASSAGVIPPSRVRLGCMRLPCALIPSMSSCAAPQTPQFRVWASGRGKGTNRRPQSKRLVSYRVQHVTMSSYTVIRYRLYSDSIRGARRNSPGRAARPATWELGESSPLDRKRPSGEVEPFLEVVSGPFGILFLVGRTARC